MNKKLKITIIVVAALLGVSLIGIGIIKYQNHKVLSENEKLNEDAEPGDVVEVQNYKDIYCYTKNNTYEYFVEKQNDKDYKFVGEYHCKNENCGELTIATQENIFGLVYNNEFVLIKDTDKVVEMNILNTIDDDDEEASERYYIHDFINNKDAFIGNYLPIEASTSLELILKDNKPYELVFDNWYHIETNTLTNVFAEDSEKFIKQNSLPNNVTIKLSNKINTSHYSKVDTSKYDFKDYTDATCSGWTDFDWEEYIQGNVTEDVELVEENCPNAFTSTEEGGGFRGVIDGDVVKYSLNSNVIEDEINFVKEYNEKPISLKAYFSVAIGNIMFVLTDKNNLYVTYQDYQNDKITTKLLQNNVKKFTVTEDDKLYPSEGQSMVIIIESIDGNYYYGTSYLNMKDKKLLSPDSYEFLFFYGLNNNLNDINFYASNKKGTSYLKYNKKDIVVSKLYYFSPVEDIIHFIIVDESNNYYVLSVFNDYVEIKKLSDVTIEYKDNNYIMHNKTLTLNNYGITPIIENNTFIIES